jgi:AAA15 family ATPase/GTPase
MKIKDFQIKNFKSIRDVRLSCKKINLFIGEPNTGKSNLLEVFALLSFCAYKKNYELKDFVRFEKISNLFFDDDIGKNIVLKDTFEEIVFEFFVRDLKFYGVVEAKYVKNNAPFREETLFFELSFSNGGGNCSLSNFLKNYLYNIKFYRFKKQNVFADLQSSFLLPPYGDNLLSVLMSNKEIKGAVMQLLKQFNYRLMFRPQENKMEIIKEYDDILISIPYFLISDTFQRLIFYLSAILSNRNSVLILEEPESHTFPYYTKFLAECIALDNKDNQFFITTHNPYFLLSVLEKAKKDDVAIFVVYLEDYETKIKMLTEKEMEETLSEGIDFFFNLDRFIGEED